MLEGYGSWCGRTWSEHGMHGFAGVCMQRMIHAFYLFAEPVYNLSTNCMHGKWQCMYFQGRSSIAFHTVLRLWTVKAYFCQSATRKLGTICVIHKRLAFQTKLHDPCADCDFLGQDGTTMCICSVVHSFLLIMFRQIDARWHTGAVLFTSFCPLLQQHRSRCHSGSAIGLRRLQQYALQTRNV